MGEDAPGSHLPASWALPASRPNASRLPTAHILLPATPHNLGPKPRLGTSGVWVGTAQKPPRMRLGPFQVQTSRT